MRSSKGYIISITNLLISLMLFFQTAYADRTKQALKYLERGELDKVEEIVIKSLEKEPINPVHKYLYAVLYSNNDFPRYNIDTARMYILVAIDEFADLDEKEILELEKSSISYENFKERKKKIQTLAFQEVVVKNAIDEFNVFLNENPDASQVGLAIKKRDSLAYLATELENTWNAYSRFMKMYPNSVDFERAKSNYDHLVFQSKTRSGKLADLKKFIDDHPDSPYKNDILEEIFSIIGADGDSESILSFTKEYSNINLTKRAVDILYHFGADTRKELFRLRHYNFKSIIDSVKSATRYDGEIIFPILEDGQYVFVNFSGEEIIKDRFDQIDAKYFCGNISDDVLSVMENAQGRLINRNGTVVFEDVFDTFEDIGIGVLKVGNAGKYRAIHKSGAVITNSEYDDISIVGNRLLKVRKNGKVGLVGITGRKICPHDYDDIYTVKDYWVFEENEKIGLLTYEEIIAGANGGILDPIMKYEEAELIDDNYLICYRENKEVLFDNDLRKVVPEGEQIINTRFETWTTKQPYGYRVFNKEVGELTHTLYDNLIQNREWLALEQNGKWSVYRKGLKDSPIIGLDSVKLIGDDIAMVFRELAGIAIFPNKKTVEFTTGDELYSIGHVGASEKHYLVINKNGKHTLFQNGEVLFTTDYDEIGYISDSAFYVKEGEKYGAVDVDGRLIMRVRYNAITRAENGIAPVLFNGKFGAYNFTDRILLKLDYDQKLRSYNNELLIVRLEGKEGFLNKYNEDIIEPEYDFITYWTDSIALVRNTNTWSLIDIYSNDEIFGGILDYKTLNQSNDQTTIRIRTATGYGIYDTNKGLVIPPTFSDIININTIQEPLYFCEKSVPEGDYYIAIYKDRTGKTIRSQAYRAEEYERIVCE